MRTTKKEVAAAWTLFVFALVRWFGETAVTYVPYAWVWGAVRISAALDLLAISVILLICIYFRAWKAFSLSTCVCMATAVLCFSRKMPHISEAAEIERQGQEAIARTRRHDKAAQGTNGINKACSEHCKFCGDFRREK